MGEKKKVVILGGGVAGMTAAHELLDRGFDVEVYERWTVPGGKARSYPHLPEGTDSSKWKHGGLPAEHGFRFFPGFYKHIPDTMSRIRRFKPDTADVLDDKHVIDNLVKTTEFAVTTYDEAPFRLPTHMPYSLRGLIEDFRKYFSKANVELDQGELTFYAERIWQVLTSCQERRDYDYERTGWWDFIDARNKSRNYKRFLGNLSRTLVAANPRKASAKTNGNILAQMVLDTGRRGVDMDRVLNGPTNEVWIHPWMRHLLDAGCRYYVDTAVQSVGFDRGHISGVTLTAGQHAGRVSGCSRYGTTTTKEARVQGTFKVDGADYYLSALPVEVMARLSSEAMIDDGDASLRNLARLAEGTSWMNGLLFYLARDIEIAHGHAIYVDPPWALTSISQPQFWTVSPATYGDERVKGILSVDVSNWLEPPDPEVAHEDDEGRKPASDYPIDEVIDLAWKDVKRSLAGGADELQDRDRLYAVLDEAIRQVLQFKHSDGDTGSNRYRQLLDNLEPLLINEVNTWSLRPDAYTRIPNLFLASDYVRTNTDLATMEAANEAARRAVNAILDAEGGRWRWPWSSRGRRCRIWKLHEPWLLFLYRWADQRRYDQGLPWRLHLPLILRLLQWLWGILHGLVSRPRDVVDRLKQLPP